MATIGKGGISLLRIPKIILLAVAGYLGLHLTAPNDRIVSIIIRPVESDSDQPHVRLVRHRIGNDARRLDRNRPIVNDFALLLVFAEGIEALLERGWETR